MIQIDIQRLTFIPQLDYAEYSMKELLFAGVKIHDVEKASEGIWVVSFGGTPVLVLGVIRSSLISCPRLWFLLCEQFGASRVNFHLRGLKKALEELDKQYPKLDTFVEESWRTGERFAKFCGFRDTGRAAKMYGRDFKVWER